MWALVSAIVNGVTWQLQESAAAHLEPKRAASIAASAATGTVYWAAETVFRWLESGSEDDLAACRASLGGYVDELMEAQNALMFGTEDLDGESVEVREM